MYWIDLCETSILSYHNHGIVWIFSYVSFFRKKNIVKTDLVSQLSTKTSLLSLIRKRKWASEKSSDGNVEKDFSIVWRYSPLDMWKIVGLGPFLVTPTFLAAHFFGKIDWMKFWSFLSLVRLNLQNKFQLNRSTGNGNRSLSDATN